MPKNIKPGTGITETAGISRSSSSRKGEPKVKKDEGRILKEWKTGLLSIFFRVVGDQSYLSRALRAEIRLAWDKQYPGISPHQWRQYLYILEKEYYEKVARWNADTLSNRITKQTMDLQEDLLEAATKNEVNIKVAKLSAIIKGNELIARVNRLYEAPVQVGISIETNIDENALTARLNRINETNEELN